MHRLVLLVLAGVMLCCLWVLLSMPLSTPHLSSALGGANVEHVDRGANAPAPLPNAPAPLPNGSYPLTPAEVPQESDELPVNFYLLTMLVLALAYFVASVGWLLQTNARRQGVMSSSLVNDRGWLAEAHGGPSFLGVFRL